MAALPYMQLYVADYLGDTYHLTTEEHGAYLLLMMAYWQSGKPIHESRLAKAARMSNERWTDVERTLNEFFFIDENGYWNHKRIDEDLEKVNAKSRKAAAAGKASAKKRSQQVIDKNKESNERSTDVKQTLNHTDTDTDTDTDKHIKTPCEKPAAISPCPHQKIIQIYHDALPQLPRVREWTPTRQKHLKSRWCENESRQNLDYWKRFFEYIAKCPHLMGDNDRNWTADLEWSIKQSNFVKILEGKYEKKKGAA